MEQDTPRGSASVPMIVGGASGIGRAVAEAYRDHGVSPLVWDIASPHDVRCDVTDPQAVSAALAETVERVGVPDQLTITAGVGHSGLLLDETVENWDRVMAVNTRGTWLVMRALARAWIDTGRPGSIVATSSVSAHLVDRAMGVYCASKSALSTLVKVAACEWAPHAIRVNAVGPGVTNTPMLGGAPVEHGWLQSVVHRTALGRLGQPADIAQVVLALHELGWVTGQVLDCDGGLSLHSPIDAFGEAERAH
jgi:NAD(P)-dependent dehydrogenase (short-subunit alcohol dehydrogenase family)